MKKFLPILFFFFIVKLSAQINLVPNPSFEDTVNCPNGASQLYNSLYWVNPSTSLGSSPDYYNACSAFMPVPTNPFGFQNARTGVAYAGFYAFQGGSPNAHEYVETMLLDSLKKDSVYCVSFNLNLGDVSSYGTNNIGLYFSNSLTTTPTNTLSVTPQLINASIILTDKINWMKLEWQYVAIGGEKYITIGNFNTALTTDTVFVGGSTDLSYYYIDDVYIGTCDTTKPTSFIIPNVFTPNNDNINDVFKIASSNLKTLDCKIYDRWGLLVWELKNVNDFWNGRTTAGLECVDGVYYYVFSAKGQDDKEYKQKGFIQLIR